MRIVQKGVMIETIPYGGEIYAFTSGVSSSELNDTNSVKAYIDTACNGHLVPVTCMSNVKVEHDVAVIGVNEGGLEITHSGFCNVLGGKGWAPRGTKYLVSMPQLDKIGCSSVTGGGKMTVYDRKGKVMIVGSMNKSDMYECRIGHVTKKVAFNSEVDYEDVEPEVDGRAVEELNAKVQDVSNNVESNVIPQKYMNTFLKERARQVRKMHSCLNHPGDKAFGDGLDNGCYPNTKLTSHDLKNAQVLLGECNACVEAKMVAAPEPESTSYHDDIVGSNWYSDLVPLPEKTVGGNTYMLVAIEGTVGYMIVSMLKHKSHEGVLEAALKIIAIINSYGHKLKTWVFDDEVVFISIFDDLRERGIIPSTTPAGSKNKAVEIKIKELKNKSRAMRVDLDYNLPKRLYGELYTAASNAINSVPNKKTGPTKTPYQVVVGKKPIIPSFKFGQIGLVNSRRQDDKDLRSEYGMFMYHMYNLEKHFKVYMLHRGQMYSKRIFVPSTKFPSSWDLTRRLKCFDDVDNIEGKEDGEIVTPLEMLEDREQVIDTPITKSMSRRDTTLEGVATMNEEIRQVKQLMATSPNDKMKMFNDEVYMESDIPISIAKPEERVSDVSMADTIDSINREARSSINVVKKEPILDSFRVTRSSVRARDEEVAPIRVTRSSAKARSEEVAPIFGANVQSYEAYVKKGSNEGRISEETYIDWDAILERSYRTSFREARTGIDEERNVLEAYRVSLKKAVSDADDVRRESAIKACDDEFDDLMGMNFAKGLLARNMTRIQLLSVIHAFMFLTEKKLGSGEFDKWKARLVAGGNEIKDTIDEDDRYSPTANHISVMTSIALAAVEKVEIRSYDVKGAYLIPDIMPGEKPIFIKLDRETASRFVDRHPMMAEFVDINGCMILQLNKYLYGLPMSGKHWNDHIVRTLCQMGYEQSPCDPCVFNKGAGVNRVRLVLWVDDILGSGRSNKLDEFEVEFIKFYKFTSHKGKSISYLALDIVSREDGGYTVASPGTREDILATFGKDLQKRKSTVKIPMPEGSIKTRDKDAKRVSERHKRVFASLVMSLMFLARMTRAELLFSVTLLASKISDPYEEDLELAFRVLAYVNDTPNYGIRFKGGDESGLRVFADASHAIHTDGKGHSSIVITLGSGYVFAKSGKLKSVTLSSTESEGDTMTIGATYIVWLRDLLTFWGYPVRLPTRLYQDNLSAIWLATHDGKFNRNKHTMVKRAYFREKVEQGVLVAMHRDTDKMPADMGTKAVGRELLTKHMKSIGMVPMLLV